MGKTLVEPTPLTADPSLDAGSEDLDLFSEAHALQSCMKFLLGSAQDKGLDETAATIALAIQAVDKDLWRFCN